MGNHLRESQVHHVELERAGPQESSSYGSLSMKFKSRHSLPLVFGQGGGDSWGGVGE